ncbi:hypothetical protein J6358_21290 [Burkholderia pseudomallei]|uniref:hypothetical protein n=1 Tax=Burkholderia pseudomallei TaxID=28450 RepID=UPI001AD70CB2|nr:hypothetical protein [Burkholderia pseudomallei]MBO7932264.1 hypothetical protein [Burkholderia pseudomallei]
MLPIGAIDGKYGANSAKLDGRPAEPAAAIGGSAVSAPVSRRRNRRHAEKAPICGETSDAARQESAGRNRPGETFQVL